MTQTAAGWLKLQMPARLTTLGSMKHTYFSMSAWALAVLFVLTFGLAGCSGTPGADQNDLAAVPDSGQPGLVRTPVAVYYLRSESAGQAQVTVARNLGAGEFALLAGMGYRKTGSEYTWSQNTQIKLSGSRETVVASLDGWAVVELKGEALLPRLPAAQGNFTVELGLDEALDGEKGQYVLLSKKLLSKAKNMISTGNGTLYLKNLEWVPAGKYFSATFAVQTR